MPSDDMTGLAREAATSGALGAVARVLWALRDHPRPSFWRLVYEAPMGSLFGWIGHGFADWQKLTGFAAVACVVLSAFLGVRLIDLAFDVIRKRAGV